ncbi:MAG: hypothetical protein IJL19_08505 [Clostridiales bacterium]|nr:hypothetical protein [Clostridiales bacterium]
MAKNDMYSAIKAIGASNSADIMADANIKMGGIGCTVAKHEIMLQALFEAMVEQGVDPELINAKVVELTDAKLAKFGNPASAKPCPRCGKMVKELADTPLLGRCMYCGIAVKFYPTFETGKKEEETTGENI